MKKRYIPKEIYAQAWNENGDIRSINEFGRRKVGKIVGGDYEVFVKQYPALPGLGIVSNC